MQDEMRSPEIVAFGKRLEMQVQAARVTRRSAAGEDEEHTTAQIS
jgi:hypothetical protein